MILETLAGWGLTKLKDLVFEKGTNFVKDKMGVDIPALIAKGEEGKLELQRIELEREKEIKDYLKTVDVETTKRWDSDNKAGIIPKLIRPLTVIYLLLIYSIMAFSDGTLLDIKPVYASGFEQMLFVAIPAYFGLRTFEKHKKVNKDH